MNIGGGEAADQLVRMMLSGSEVAVRLSGSAIKNVLALTMALAKKHKTISGKVNLAKMLKETRDVRRFSMSPEQYQQFRQRAGKQKILFSAIRDSDNKGKVVDVIMPVTEIDRANMIFERIRYYGDGKGGVVIGALLLGVVNMGMSIMGIGDSWQYVVKGAVLLIAVVFDVLSNRKNG